MKRDEDYFPMPNGFAHLVGLRLVTMRQWGIMVKILEGTFGKIHGSTETAEGWAAGDVILTSPEFEWATGLTPRKLATFCECTVSEVEADLADLLQRKMIAREADGKKWKYKLTQENWATAPKVRGASA